MTIEINGTTGISGVDGSAGTPALQGSDTNTGISFGTDEVNINTGGTERTKVDSSGRLLVGTTSALTGSASQFSKFQVHGNTANAQGCYLSFGYGGVGTSLSAGADIATINFTDTAAGQFASIRCDVDGTTGSVDYPGRLVFSTTPDGSASPVERMRIRNSGEFLMYDVYTRTDADSVNVVVKSDGSLRRSVSSIKYKTDVETLQDSYADAILSVRPVWYRSLCEGNCPEHSWWGFIAEEVAEIDPRLVHWKTVEVTYDENGSAVQTPCEPEPEGVAYDRFVPHLLNLIKRQKEQIEAMEARLSALEAS